MKDDFSQRTSSKVKRNIEKNLERFMPLIHNLQNKSASEDDTKIVINDILSDVLGYDKCNELKTEFREKNNRLDYVVQLVDGPNKRKKNKMDFIIEAKSPSNGLKQDHVNQTLSYALNMGLRYFIVTNAVHWKLFYVKKQGKTPLAELIYDVNFSISNKASDFASDFYNFSRFAYASNEWSKIKEMSSVATVENIATAFLQDRVINAISKELRLVFATDVDKNFIKDTIENDILKPGTINKKLSLKMKGYKKSLKIAS